MRIIDVPICISTHVFAVVWTSGRVFLALGMFAFDVDRGAGIADGYDGLTEYRTDGTYAHVHPESGAFDTFLDSV